MLTNYVCAITTTFPYLTLPAICMTTCTFWKISCKIIFFPQDNSICINKRQAMQQEASNATVFFKWNVIFEVNDGCIHWIDEISFLNRLVTGLQCMFNTSVKSNCIVQVSSSIYYPYDCEYIEVLLLYITSILYFSLAISLGRLGFLCLCEFFKMKLK